MFDLSSKKSNSSGGLALKFGALTLIFVFVFIVNIGVSWWSMNQRKSDGVIIGAVAQMPMLSQKMAKDALIVRYREGGDVAFELRRAIDVFDMTMDAVTYGGEVPLDLDMFDFVTIPPPEDEELEATIASASRLWGPYRERLRRFIAGGGDEADVAFVQAASDRVLLSISEIVRVMSKRSEAQAKAQFLVQSVALGLVVLLGGLLFVAYTSRAIAKPVGRLALAADRIDGGDLTTEIDKSKRRDEIGRLMGSFASMRDSLSEALTRMQSGVISLSSNAAQIATTAKEYSGTTAQQASAIAEVSTTVEEIKQTSRSAVETAQGVVDSAEAAAETGREGREAVITAVETMDVIGERVGGIATKIVELSEKNQQIGSILETVSNLAEQSNLLAVNAGIEAAKAGEQGRGFAVVASEVRNLAEQSKRATQQIRSILLEIQRATESTVMATEEGTKRANDGRLAVAGVQTVIEDLSAALGDSADSARRISASASQQAAGIEQIAEALTSIAAAGSENIAGVRALESAVTGLTELSSALKGSVERYTLS